MITADWRTEYLERYSAAPEWRVLPESADILTRYTARRGSRNVTSTH